MTKFEIDSANGNHWFVYRFNSRYEPAIMYGMPRLAYQDCTSDIAKVKKAALSVQNISTLSNRNGYRFIVNGADGTPVASSRFFPAQRLMKRVIAILQNQIKHATVPGNSNTISFTSAA